MIASSSFARVSATYIKRRSSSSSSGSSTARDDGNHPSTAQITKTAFHSLPLALCTVLSTNASDSDSEPPARSWVLDGGSSASAARKFVRDGYPAEIVRN